jgi:hypothetical protein
LIDHYVEMSTVEDTSVQRLMPLVRPLLAPAPPLPGEPEPPKHSEPVESNWMREGPFVWLHSTGMAMACCEHSRPGKPWNAALRGPAAGLIDPTWLTDDLGRIFDFDSAEAAREACDAELAALETQEIGG